MITVPKPWRIEVRVGRTIVDEWALVKKPGSQAPYRFVTKDDADEQCATLARIQPHVTYRVTRV